MTSQTLHSWHQISSIWHHIHSLGHHTTSCMTSSPLYLTSCPLYLCHHTHPIDDITATIWHLGSESKVRVLQCSPSPVPSIQMYIAWTSRPEVGPCTPAWCLCSSGSSPRWPWWKVFWAPSKAAGWAGGKSEVRRSEDGEALLRQPALLPFLALSSCNFNSCVSLAVYSNSGHLSVLCNCVATPLPCEGFTTGDKVKWKDQPWAHHWPYSSLVSLCIFNLNTHCHYKNESGRVNTC